ncbi:hypothetical protein [Couchioplanes caeruleus]|uniref:hypothetical protein n=1 Tax=Couchioplanes caeruleus TaxID=56438 RepID=UPI0011608BA2|nr:hypothetical protein [Couchioplanes caeruleus]
MRAAALLLAPLPAACAPDAGDDGLAGTAVVVSDMGMSDSPIDEGWIIAVPADTLDDLWTAADVQPVDQTAMRYMSVPLSRDQATRAGGEIAPLDDDGEFVLPPGSAITCSAASS